MFTLAIATSPGSAIDGIQNLRRLHPSAAAYAVNNKLGKEEAKDTKEKNQKDREE